jgi:MerR family redox-sensitive transcriptional activator SoxR
MHDGSRLFAIGELARQTGLATSALRYYERVGMLRTAVRAGGRRHYRKSSAERVAWIQFCQDVGFTLLEICAFVVPGRRRGRPWAPLAETKLRQIDRRIAGGERARTMIQHALACPHRNLVTCPNFRATLKSYLDSRKRRGTKLADENVVPRVMQRDRDCTADRMMS